MKRFNWQKKLTSINKSADKDTEVYWSQLKHKTYSGKLDSIQNWLEGLEEASQPHAGSRQVNLKDERFFNMFNLYKSHKLGFVTTIMSLLLFVVACNYPVEYTETMGHMLDLTVAGDQQAAEALAREVGLNGYDLSYRVMNKNGEFTTTISTLLPGEDRDVYDAVISAIDSHPGMIRYNLAAIDETATVPAYRRILRNVFHLSIDLSDMTEDEIALQIRGQLIQQGANPSRIEVVFHEDESMEFLFEFEATSDGQEELFEINMVMEGDCDENLELDIGGDLEPGEDGEIIIKEIIGGPDGLERQMIRIAPEEIEGLNADEVEAYINSKFLEAGLEPPKSIQFKMEDGKMDIDIEK
ncbi:MAG: hypothetical protein H8D46_01600 [FCB group bacterium]|nr:hypothetical protein [FCB group bacterium]